MIAVSLYFSGSIKPNPFLVPPASPHLALQNYCFFPTYTNFPICYITCSCIFPDFAVFLPCFCRVSSEAFSLALSLALRSHYVRITFALRYVTDVSLQQQWCPFEHHLGYISSKKLKINQNLLIGLSSL